MVWRELDFDPRWEWLCKTYVLGVLSVIWDDDERKIML